MSQDLLIVETNANKFNDDVLLHRGIVLVDFYGPNCVPCKTADEFLTRLKRSRPDVKVVKANTFKYPRLATDYQINSIPTFIVFKDGKIVARRQGITGGYPGIVRLVNEASK